MSKKLDRIIKDIQENGIPVMVYDDTSSSYVQIYIKDVNNEILDMYVEMTKKEIMGDNQYENHKSLKFEALKAVIDDNERGEATLWDYVPVGHDTGSYTNNYGDVCQYITEYLNDLEKSNPKRYDVIMALYAELCTETDYAKGHGISQQAVSKMHIRVLQKMEKDMLSKFSWYASKK